MLLHPAPCASRRALSAQCEAKQSCLKGGQQATLLDRASALAATHGGELGGGGTGAAGCREQEATGWMGKGVGSASRGHSDASFFLGDTSEAKEEKGERRADKAKTGGWWWRWRVRVWHALPESTSPSVPLFLVLAAPLALPQCLPRREGGRLVRGQETLPVHKGQLGHNAAQGGEENPREERPVVPHPVERDDKAVRVVVAMIRQ